MLLARPIGRNKIVQTRPLNWRALIIIHAFDVSGGADVLLGLASLLCASLRMEDIITD